MASARLTAFVGTGGYGEARVDPAIAGIDDGARYTASASINVSTRSSGQRVTLYVLWRNFAGFQLGKVQAATTTATGVRTLTGTLTAPTGTVSAQVAVTVENGGIADVYFDDVRLKLGNVALSATPPGAADAPVTFGTVFGAGRTLTDRPAPTIVVGGSVGASGVLPVSVECVAPSVTTCAGALRVRAANTATTGARRTFRVRRPGSLRLRINLPSAVVRRLASAPRGSAVAVEVILTDTGGATSQVTRRVVYLRR